MAVDVPEVLLEAELHVVRAWVVAVGVGGLDEQDVRARRILEVAQDRLVGLPEVAGEEQAVVVAVVRADVELHQGRAEDVARVEELERDAAADLARLVQVRRHEELHARVYVALLVQRLEELLALLAALLVHVLEVALLQEARVAQHDVAQVRRRLAREDAPREALPHELREVARMVDVRMREDHVVDRLGVDREVTVLLERLLAVPLVEPAVEQDPLAVGLDEVHRPRRRLCRSVEGNFHTHIIAHLHQPYRAPAKRNFLPLRVRDARGYGPANSQCIITSRTRPRLAGVKRNF